MALIGGATEMTRIDPKNQGEGDTWQERLVTNIFWEVMASGTVFYPFYVWILQDQAGNTELFFSYNGADYVDRNEVVTETTQPTDISPKIIEVLRDYQG